MSADPVGFAPILSPEQRSAMMDMARSVDLVWDEDPVTLPASHSANMMQIESTLLSFGDAVSMVHQLPLSKVGLHPVERRTARDGSSGDFVGLDATAVVEALRSDRSTRQDDPPLTGAYSHLRASELLSVVEDGLAMVLGRAEPLVINQGVPTLDNLYMAGNHRQGFRDWSQLTVADRHWDLALACADIVSQCGPAGLAVFLDGYGIDRVDPVRLDWYSHVVVLRST